MSSTSSSATSPRFRMIREEFWLVVVPLATLLAALSVLHLYLDVRRVQTVPPEWRLGPNLYVSAVSTVIELAAIAFFVHRAWSRHLAGAKRGSE